jgi:hypothetical protein
VSPVSYYTFFSRVFLFLGVLLALRLLSLILVVCLGVEASFSAIIGDEVLSDCGWGVFGLLLGDQKTLNKQERTYHDTDETSKMQRGENSQGDDCYELAKEYS